MGKRETQVHLRLTDEEKAAIDQEARRHGIAMSEWMRIVLRKRLGLLTAQDEIARETA